MKNSLNIPEKCKVGFNLRPSTYTGFLGYIIMHDGTKWRKEESWESWRTKYITEEDLEIAKKDSFLSARAAYKNQYEHYKLEMSKPEFNSNRCSYYPYEIISKITDVEEFYKFHKCDDIDTYTYHNHTESADPKIKPIEFDNEPLEGFVLNKKVGGNTGGWNPRQTYCRVYDPRGWEFEITIPNLLYILETTNSIKGKGLEGKFVYSWSGKDLVLLPEDSKEYQESVEFSKTLKLKVSKKELVPGRIYLCADGSEKIFITEGYEKNWREDVKNVLWFKDIHHKTLQSVGIGSVKKHIGEDLDFANTYSQLEKYPNYSSSSKFVPFSIEDCKNSYNTISVYEEVGSKYKKLGRLKYTPSYRSGSFISITLGKENFSSKEEFIKKYPKLWQQKTMN